MTTTAVHPETNGHIKRFNKTLVSRFRLYIADNQKSRNIFEQPVKYTYSCQVHCSTNDTRSNLILSRHPQEQTIAISPSTLPEGTSTATDLKTLRQQILHQFAAIRNRVPNTLKRQQARYKWYLAKKVHTLSTFTIEQHIYLDRPLLVLGAEDRKTSTRYNKLQSHTTGLIKGINVKRQVITID